MCVTLYSNQQKLSDHQYRYLFHRRCSANQFLQGHRFPDRLEQRQYQLHCSPLHWLDANISRGQLRGQKKLSNVISISPLPNCPGKHIETRPWCNECTNMGMIAISNVCYYLVKDNNVVNSWVSSGISWQIRITCNGFLWCYWFTKREIVKQYRYVNLKKVWTKQQPYFLKLKMTYFLHLPILTGDILFLKMLEWCFEFARSACFAKASFSIFSNVSNSSTFASNWVIRTDCFFKLRSSSDTLSIGSLHLFSKEDIRASWNLTIIWSSSIFVIANFQSELLSKGSVFLVKAALEEYSAKREHAIQTQREASRYSPTMRKGKLRTYVFMFTQNLGNW